MNDDQLSLASAYLADDVSDADRAMVEADPELLAIVEQFRTVTRAVADVAPPADDVRERAISAALSAWDATVQTTPKEARAGESAPNVVPMRRRPRSARVLGIAAACLALAALGAVVVNGQRSSDDSVATQIDAPSDDFGADMADSAETFEAPAAAELESSDDADDLMRESAPFESDATADADASDESADAPDTEAGAADGGAAPPTFTATTAPPPELADEVELAELVRLLLDEADIAGSDQVDADDAVVTCDGLLGRELGEAVYDGRPVVVGVDADGERARAVDPIECSLVADTPLDTGAD